jgi:hypothetical protein
MVGKTIGLSIAAQQVPVYIERFGNTKDEIFVTASSLRKELGSDAFDKLPTGALGLYKYYERLAQGLRQLMAGSRKFSLEHLSRNDLAALTQEAAEISNIRYIMDVDKSEVDSVLPEKGPLAKGAIPKDIVSDVHDASCGTGGCSGFVGIWAPPFVTYGD